MAASRKKIHKKKFKKIHSRPSSSHIFNLGTRLAVSRRMVVEIPDAPWPGVLGWDNALKTGGNMGPLGVSNPYNGNAINKTHSSTGGRKAGHGESQDSWAAESQFGDGQEESWQHQAPSLFAAMLDHNLSQHYRIRDALSGCAVHVLSRSSRLQKPCLQERHMDARLV